jgi:hypothetical protein
MLTVPRTKHNNKSSGWALAFPQRSKNTSKSRILTMKLWVTVKVKVKQRKNCNGYKKTDGIAVQGTTSVASSGQSSRKRQYVHTVSAFDFAFCIDFLYW